MDLSYLILNYNTSYFAKAEEYIELQKIFMKETFLENLSVWIDMIAYPIYILVSIFVFHQSLSIFMVSSVHKCVTMWLNWLRYKELNAEMRTWMNIVRSMGGPFISTNDPTYHMYVYADGMVRLEDSLLRHAIFTKERTKRL